MPIKLSVWKLLAQETPPQRLKAIIGEHFDIHNSNWSTIRMPEVHMLDLGITKNYYGLEMGIKVNNLLDEDYQAPHGFSQQGINLGLIIKSRF